MLAKLKSLQFYQRTYTSHPIPIPQTFLAPLADPSTISVTRIDFTTTPLPEYAGLHAIILDNVLTQAECDELIHLAERSAGAHDTTSTVPNNGWSPALVNGGSSGEFLAVEYRNSDRIIWDESVIAGRLWARVLQAEGVREELEALDAEKEMSKTVLGAYNWRRGGGQWRVTEQGINERLRFLRYGVGQYFRQHQDGAYSTPDNKQRSFYTIHLYLNDSIQALDASNPASNPTLNTASTPPQPTEPNSHEILHGGATTFHSPFSKRRLDVDPKAGRVLIFQHAKLVHSGDEVEAGIKYTVRSDIMYEFVMPDDGMKGKQDRDEDGDGEVIFA